MKRQEGYKCEFCNKMSLSKSAMMKHEAACRHNPENISMCKDCKWLERFDGQTNTIYGFSTKYTEFTCQATGKKLYHNKVLRFKITEIKDDIIGRCDGKMPNINEGCPHFQAKSFPKSKRNLFFEII